MRLPWSGRPGSMYSVLFVGPMLPATKRGLSGLRRVKSSAARRASSAAFLLISKTWSSQAELLQRQPVGVEGAGLDDVGAGFQVGAVDVLDQPRLASAPAPRCSSSATPDELRKRSPR